MISSVRGKLIYSDSQVAVVECGGVGFKCYSSLNTLSTLPKVGNEVFLNTYLSVREDALDLYGFATVEELECFKLLTSVSGVGAKIGIAMLSDYTPDKITFFIASGDSKALTKSTGVGAKLAQRIVLELKDKLSKGPISLSSDTIAVENIGKSTASSEAVAALVSLGFSQSEASLAVSKLDPTLPTDELIKGGLKNLSRQV
ncbi:MAG: Holliday junction branch migration protein RuvA [Clostridia bacterium]|nr:Holliday junction branch migration protein RuvA [Clostridia bacterium]